ncbi:MAG TPA: cupin domain-containing protein [Xanthobacteraceae bacterium]|jgi:mannose-6-phosphate isomerase-like protein (cupin superfamily)
MKHIVSLTVAAAALLAAGYAAGQQQSPAPEVRRVVTALDKSGKAVALFDGPVPLKSFRSPNPAGDMWVTQAYPADFNWTEDRGKTDVKLQPPKNGTIFRIVDFVPTTEAIDKMPIDTMMKVAGADAPAKGLPPRHPMMHRTRTVDYALIMSGEIDMMLDEGEVHLKAGDVVVQQATNHAWINRGKTPCRVAFILMDSQQP